MLGGFPNEDPADYAQQTELIPLLVHLPAPEALYLVTVQRFAPLYVRSEEFGLCNVRASKAYEYIYPFPAEDLKDLAFQFDFDFADGRDPSTYTRELKRAIQVWREDHVRSVLSSRTVGDELVIRDTRPVALKEEVRLRGARRAIYEFCDAAHTPADIQKHLAASGLAFDDAPVEGVLAEFIQAKLMVSENDRYLSLAVDQTFKDQMYAELLISSLVDAPAD